MRNKKFKTRKNKRRPIKKKKTQRLLYKKPSANRKVKSSAKTILFLICVVLMILFYSLVGGNLK